MNRRNFFAFLPVVPIVAMNSVEVEAKPDISAGAPIPEATRITFQGNKKVEHKPTILTTVSNTPGNSITLGSWSMSQADHNKNVEMAVGDDGYLWLKRKDGQWKRIATE